MANGGRRPYRATRDERRIDICELACQGVPDREIAQVLGMTYAAVQKVRQRADVRTAPVRFRWTTERRREVARLLGEGAAPVDVDRHLGLSLGATNRWLNRTGISSRLVSADLASAVRIAGMRGRGMSDAAVCGALAWTHVPAQFQQIRGTESRLYMEWTVEEDAQLRRLTAARLDTGEVSTVLGRSASAIMVRREALGLQVAGSRRRRLGNRQQKRWTSDQDSRLLTLMRSGKGYQEIGAELGRTDEAVRKRAWAVKVRTQQGLQLAG